MLVTACMEEAAVTEQKKTTRRYAPEFIAQKITEFQESGLSSPRFARAHGLNKDTFYGWVRRAGLPHKTSLPPSSTRFLPVLLSPPRFEGTSSLLLELKGGARLTLPSTTDLRSLGLLLRALEDDRC